MLRGTITAVLPFVMLWGVALALSLFIIGKKLNKPGLARWGGVGWVVGAGIFVVFVGLVACGFVDISRPSKVYKIAFGVSPTPDVTAMRSYVFSPIFPADSEKIAFLAFKASPGTIKGLTSHVWERMPQGQDFDLDYFGENPDWWQPQKTKTTVSYCIAEYLNDTEWKISLLIYDTKSQQTYYAYSNTEGADDVQQRPR